MSSNTFAADAVVIGAGISGLVAAVTLAEGGARVVVFEKQRSPGGTSNFFQGMFAVESRYQKSRYITYSRDEAFTNVMEYSHWRANPRLVRAIVNESAATIDWLGRQGVEFTEVTINMPDAPQTYHVVRGRGEAAIRALVTRAKSLGVDIRLATPVKKLVKADGSISGVIAEQDEEDVRIAARAVVIATGGYANNREWIKKYAGFDLEKSIVPVGNTGKTGDGIRMAFEAGADSEGLGVLELFRTGPIVPGFVMGCSIEQAVVQPDLWVNTSGERFCNEAIGFYDTSVGNASARQKDGCTYSIFDTGVVKRVMEEGIDKSVSTDFPPGSRFPDLEQELERAIGSQSSEVYGADSIGVLAEKMRVDAAILQATIDEYNYFCRKGHDDLFAKDPKYLRPILGPRFYAVRARTVFLGTLGGIKINHRAEVISQQSVIIPGLYAVGYDAGGMYGDGYCIKPSSGLSSAFAANSGRLAGKNALRYLGKQ